VASGLLAGLLAGVLAGVLALSAAQYPSH